MAKRHSLFAAVAAWMFSTYAGFAQFASPNATVYLSNESRVPIIVEDVELRPGASVRVKVPARAAGIVKVSAPKGYRLERTPIYPMLEPGMMYAMHLNVLEGEEPPASPLDATRSVEPAVSTVPEATASAALAAPVPAAPDTTPAPDTKTDKTETAPDTTSSAAKPAPALQPSNSPTISDDAMRKALLEFRMRFSADPTNALVQFAHMSPSRAEEQFARMTCRMPMEFNGFFRDFVRRTMPWVEPSSDGWSLVCLYNPWCDGAILFPIHRENDSFSLSAPPAIVAGEFFRGERLADAGLVADGEDFSETLSPRVARSHAGFSRLAKNGEWPIARFETWDEADRQAHLRAVFSRVCALTRDQTVAVLLEAEGRQGAVRYGAFLEALGKKADVSAVLTPSAAKTWGDLPEAFRKTLWPVRVISCADGILTVWQSALVPETALCIEFRDEAGEDTNSISFLDFE